MLPDTSGEELIQELKEIGDFPVIMLTSKSSEEERVAGFALGADDYVCKTVQSKRTYLQSQSSLKTAPEKTRCFRTHEL